ncbi:MAG: hypothetical protein HOJ12_03460 [Flavobacteriales bacterium]|nr:hypothetical protein [Flavobacteriales bacterium]
MHNNLLKIFCFFIFFVSSFSVLSQDKIKFGYHNQSGKVKNIKTKAIEENIEEEKTLSIISETLDDYNQRQLDGIDSINDIIDSNIFISEIKDTILVSVLLPLYIERNDTLVNFLRENMKDTNQIYSKSELALDFLEGIMFAIDSLSELQIPIKLQVFDTENNLDTVRKISNSKFVKQSTIVFGPIYSKNFNFFRNKFRADRNKIIINPLSDNQKYLQNSKNVYFLQPSLKQKRDSICLFINKFEKSKDIYFVSLESEDKTLDYNQIKFRLDSVFTEFPLNKFENLSVINKQSFTFLNPDSNLVFVLSEDEVFIKKIVTFIRAIDTNVSIYSSEIITKIKGIDIEDLMRLDIHVPVSNYFDNYSQKNKYLQNKFESIFYHKMNENSRLSFYSILHFCSHQKQYHFTQLFKGGGFINTDVQICTYKDYRLLPIE